MNRLGNEAVELKEKDIEKYLNEALPELNIRLWTDMYGEELGDIKDIKIENTNMSLVIDEITNKNKILWLESITLTSYTPHDARRSIQSNTSGSTPCRNKWRIFNRLMGMKAFKLPFTLKKYRKERR